MDDWTHRKKSKNEFGDSKKLKAVVLCNMSKNISLKLKKMAKKSAFLTAPIHEMRQKTVKLAVFLRTVVKHNRNKLQYGKSAKTNDYISRNRPKTLILAIFGALSPSYA